MGNRRKPAKIRKFEGKRGHHPIPNEPEFNSIYREPPDRLTDWGKHAWVEVGKQLSDSGVLQVPDYLLFEVFCDTWGQWRTLRDEGKAGTHLLAQLRQMAGEFALSPCARAKLGVQEQKKEDSMEKLLEETG